VRVVRYIQYYGRMMPAHEIRRLVDEQVQKLGRQRGLTRAERVKQYSRLLEAVFEADRELKEAYARS
jgi:hypothetical protein